MKNDQRLIKAIMTEFDWKQRDVARFLGIGASNISRYLKGTQGMHPMSRKALTQKLQDVPQNGGHRRRNDED